MTVVGIPLAFGLLAGLLLTYALGHSATGWILGPVDRAQTNRLGRGFLADWQSFAWSPRSAPSHRRSAG